MPSETKKSIGIETLERIVDGLLSGKLVLQVVTANAAPRGTKRRSARAAAKPKPAKRGRPGRKPLTAAEKARRERIRKQLEKREIKSKLPDNRELRLFLIDHYEGSKVTAIARHFGVKRTAIQPLLDRAVARGEISLDKGLYYNRKPVRHRRPPRKAPVAKFSNADVLAAIREQPGITMQELATRFRVNYQRFIRPINAWVAAGTVAREGTALRVLD